MGDRTGNTETGPRATSAPLLSRVLMSVPVVAVVVLVGLPLAVVVWRATGRVPVDDDQSTLSILTLMKAVGRTLVTTLIIALMATALALPVGWLLRGAGRGMRRLGAFVLVPMLLPSYLAFAGWTLLRAPMTTLGDAIAEAPALVRIWAAPVIGVWGLTTWVWPLAALILGAAARRVDQSVLDALDLDGASRWRRALGVGRMMLPGIIASMVLVMVVMSGSMIPLDVSSVETYGVVLMRWVQQHPSDVPVWRASWPLVLIAMAATLLILRGARPGDGSDEGSLQGRSSRGRPWLLLWAIGVWSLAVVVPGVLFLLSLREPPHAATLNTIRRFMWAFWRDSGSAVVSSTSVAARVGLVALVISGASWFTASRGRGGRRLIGICSAMFMVMGLMPGVLVGTATRRGVDMALPMIGNSSWIVVLAHLIRFAFVGSLLGLWLAGRESREELNLRMIDGGDSPRGFVHACVARHWGIVLGGALATTILSFHEIEATVITWPPGMRNLAQEMLDALHFQRDERLGAAAVNLMGIGAALAYLAGWLMLGRGSMAHRD